VINVMFHAQRLTGEARIAGLLGGLHLTGGLFEARIQPTVEALRAAGVGRVLPAHCSGWRAVHAIARAMPEAFVQCAVGTTLTFDASPGYPGEPDASGHRLRRGPFALYRAGAQTRIRPPA